MKRKEHLSLGEKGMVVFGNLFTRMTMGYVQPIMIEEMIRTFGVGGYMRWAKAAEGVMKLMGGRHDDAIAQLMLGLAAMWNGCTWCGQGHIKAHNVMRHKERGEMFPLDENAIMPLQRLRDSEVLARLRELLADPKYATELRLIERQYELKSLTATGTDDDDDMLRASIAAWDWATECSIMVPPDVVVPATAPIGKDKKACRAYDEARSVWRAQMTNGKAPAGAAALEDAE